MFLIIPDLLSSDEVRRVREAIQNGRFVDGRVSNEYSPVKKNRQMPHDDAASAIPARVVRDAIFRNPQLSAFCFPKTLATPTISEYEPGMYYGRHVDDAHFPSKPRPMRSDVSCTVFICDPQDYEGGELEIEFGSKAIKIKEPAGAAVLYPSTTIHQVRPVTKGKRIVALTWIESYIADPQHREILYRLREIDGREAKRMSHESRVLLGQVRTNLYRFWSQH